MGMSEQYTQDNNLKREKISRRYLLKGVGLIGSTGMISGVTSAESNQPTNKERLERDLERALQIRKKTGSTERGTEYLMRKSDYFQSKHKSFNQKSSDGPTTQNWSEAAITTDLNLYYYTSDCASDPFADIEYHIQLDSDVFTTNGEKGADHISMSWDTTHYRYEESSAYQDQNMDPDNLYVYKEDLAGVDWEFRDNAACPTGCGTKEFYVGSNAELLEISQERGVQASYWDNYNQLKVCGVSIGSDGSIHFTICQSGDQSQYGYKIETDSDATFVCY